MKLSCGGKINKTQDFINKEFNSIINDSREYRAFELGMAAGYFELYKYLRSDIGEKEVNKSFKNIIEGKSRISEYFNNLIEINKDDTLFKSMFNVLEKKIN